MDDYDINLMTYDVQASTAEFTAMMYGSDNDSLTDSTMSLPGPMLTYVSVITCTCVILNIGHKATRLYSDTKYPGPNIVRSRDVSKARDW